MSWQVWGLVWIGLGALSALRFWFSADWRAERADPHVNHTEAVIAHLILCFIVMLGGPGGLLSKGLQRTRR